eukprot:CAMPEP_0114147666 /NCGR_PEP_ID=MMETSP0043_2-20121206/21221_1 /TAXON_ID=464988 /ORGANISM="Hemiselmis andersenii, Strain CCMP644" /LENGTH=37 /DNA_ID= /DNA_START= /DNA_END= /DNA_ORIENTATION=
MSALVEGWVSVRVTGWGVWEEVALIPDCTAGRPESLG